MAKVIKEVTERERWADRIAKSSKEMNNFWTSGQMVVDTYRIEEKSAAQQDKYNILYANVETIKPTLYAQRPKPEVKKRQRDQSNPIAQAASLAIEATLEYVLDDQEDDFDGVMGDAVQDLLLPGMGMVWPRYEAQFQDMVDPNSGQPILDPNTNEPVQEVSYETVRFDYVFWKDVLWNKCRRWSEVWWLARGSWMDKEKVKARFGDKVCGTISFTSPSEGVNKEESVEDGQARIWEIWNKKTREVIWFCNESSMGVIDRKKDPLKLKKFFPTPKPLFAITTTNKSIPRPFFSQYQAQADELNDITARIRRLVDALRVIGIYDASIPALANLLTGKGNKMVPVEGWATVQDKGGLKGVVDFLPIKEVATTLMQLYDARDRVKAEIYEITGWSDIIRGVSKASETLGAQKLKSDWAGARLKLAQRDVQRYIRDLFRTAGEIISEHFSETTIALAIGMQYDPNSEVAAVFKKVMEVLRNEKERCNLIGVETDSMLMPDEANDKAERMEFVGAAGAFLQQAVPAIQTKPELAPLLGEILMFAVRSFRSARPLEEKFEQFSQLMTQGAGGGANGQQQEGGVADAQAKTQSAQIAAQTKLQSDNINAQVKNAAIQEDARQFDTDLAFEREKEMNRHAEKMRELDIKAQQAAVDEMSRTAEHALKVETNATDTQFRAQDAVRADEEARNRATKGGLT